jgi:hypothetical protein
VKHVFVCIVTVLVSYLLSISSIAAADNAYERRIFNFSLFGSISTNGVDSPRILNHAAFGLLGNSAAQVAGFQLALGINSIENQLWGVQLTPLANLVWGSSSGMQISLFNYSGRGENLMQAGFVNLIQETVRNTAQLGLLNVAQEKSTEILQIGVVNYGSDQGIGLQAGYLNISGSGMGGQMGFLNIAKETKDQVGFVNLSGEFKGSKAGLVNIGVDAGGTTYGFLNLIQHGQFKMEYSLSSRAYTLLALHHGSKRTYTSYFVGQRRGLTLTGRLPGQRRILGLGFGVAFPQDFARFEVAVMKRVSSDCDKTFLLRFLREHSFGKTAIAMGLDYEATRPGRCSPLQDVDPKFWYQQLGLTFGFNFDVFR